MPHTKKVPQKAAVQSIALQGVLVPQRASVEAVTALVHTGPLTPLGRLWAKLQAKEGKGPAPETQET